MSDKGRALGLCSVILVGACASADGFLSDGGPQPADAAAVTGADGSGGGLPDAVTGLVDAGVLPDARVAVDAGHFAVDAWVPADGPGPIDAGSPVDSGCSSVELLANGDLEQGSNGDWVEVGGGFPLIYDDTDLPVAPQGGSFAAWLGGDDSVDHQLSQAVVIPAGTTALTLTGWRWIATDDGYGYDWLDIELYDAGGTYLEALALWSDLDEDTTWVNFSRTPQNVYAGETVHLAITASLDGSYNTNFFFDTLSFTATNCP